MYIWLAAIRANMVNIFPMSDTYYAGWRGRAAVRAFAMLLIPLLIIADQLSKWVVMETFFSRRPRDLISWLEATSRDLGDTTPVVISPFLRLVAVWNPGVSFGMLQIGTPLMRWGLVGMTVLFTIIFFIWMVQSHSRLQIISLAMIISGALGNLIDRVRFGAVYDFIDIHYGPHHWPAFNLADSCITVGAVLMVVSILRGSD